jgi:hypothetical protein
LISGQVTTSSFTYCTQDNDPTHLFTELISPKETNAVIQRHCETNGNNLPGVINGSLFLLESRLIVKGALATTSFITVPAVVAIAPSSDASQPLNLIKRRVNMMTAACGTVSVATLGLAFLFGAKHPYLLYAGATTAILLRNQRQAIQDLGEWLRDEYHFMKEFISEYTARSDGHRTARSSKKPSRNAGKTAAEPEIPPAQVAGALEKLGAASLTNCLVAGIAFGIASIGVYGDVD